MCDGYGEDRDADGNKQDVAGSSGEPPSKHAKHDSGLRIPSPSSSMETLPKGVCHLVAHQVPFTKNVTGSDPERDLMLEMLSITPVHQKKPTKGE
jgi:hypothetical protein